VEAAFVEIDQRAAWPSIVCRMGKSRRMAFHIQWRCASGCRDDRGGQQRLILLSDGHCRDRWSADRGFKERVQRLGRRLGGRLCFGRQLWATA